MKNNFDKVAKVYDALAALVFGDKLDKAQQTFVNKLKCNEKILIIGGGTGKILEWLPQDAGLMVDYLELSSQMIEKARKRRSKALETNFIQDDIMMHEGKYDVIIANFFLDCFNEEQLVRVIEKIESLMKVKGKLIVADFSLSTGQRDQLLNKLMHRFFKLVANLESDHLKDIRGIILQSEFIETHYRDFDRGQLFSGVYCKRLTQLAYELFAVSVAVLSLIM